MKNDIAIAMASKMIDFLTEATGKDISDFEIRNIDEDPNHKTFTIEFIAYNFYWIGIDYERGRITPYIITGSHIIKLRNLSDWWEEMDLDSWTDRLMAEIRLRIPDKYLTEKNWK